GSIPIITAVLPLGLQRATEAEIHLEGVHLGSVKKVHVKAGADVAVGSKLPVTIAAAGSKPLGDASVVVGEFPEVVQRVARPGSSKGVRGPTSTTPFEDPGRATHLHLPVPGTANGRIEHPGATETWRFAAKKGARLIVETQARRLGSPLDSYLEILDSAGNPVPRAVLRCVAKTYVTFRDHDSILTGIRIESWNELAI